MMMMGKHEHCADFLHENTCIFICRSKLLLYALVFIVSTLVGYAYLFCSSFSTFQCRFFLTVAFTYVPRSSTASRQNVTPPEYGGWLREVYDTVRHCDNRLCVCGVLFYWYQTRPELVKIIPVLAKSVFSRIRLFTSCRDKINNCGVENTMRCRVSLTSGHRRHPAGCSALYFSGVPQAQTSLSES